MTTNKREVSLSASRLKTLESCSWQYYAKYELRLMDKTNPGSSRGSCLHTVLECLINPRHKKKHFSSLQNDVIPASINRLIIKHAKAFGINDSENIGMIKDMLFCVISNDFYCEGAESLTAEEEFNIEIEGGVINGFIDKTATYKDGSISVQDYKSSKSKFSKEDISFNLQALMYSLSTWKKTGKIPEIKFIFARFPKNPIQIAPRCSTQQLKGFESYLSQVAAYIKDFDEEKAKSNFAYDDWGRKWLCGKAKYPGELKEDGISPIHHCAFKFPFSYFLVKDKEGKIRTALKREDLEKYGEVVEAHYAGCPRFNNKKEIAHDDF